MLPSTFHYCLAYSLKLYLIGKEWVRKKKTNNNKVDFISKGIKLSFGHKNELTINNGKNFTQKALQYYIRIIQHKPSIMYFEKEFLWGIANL